jgi:hypothetical protein|nr:MAG TPA: hypothetical protein [Caudoviricetes sp.]
MERQIYFAEMPQPLEWGEKRIVPLNITEDVTVDENGVEKKGYRADLVPKVQQPLTVDSIVDAAIAAEYDDDTLKRIMLNMAKAGDAEVEKYKSFVSGITEAAKAAGYN